MADVLLSAPMIQRAFILSVCFILCIGFTPAQETSLQHDNKYRSAIEFRYGQMPGSGILDYIDDTTNLDLDFPVDGSSDVAQTFSLAAHVQLNKYHVSIGITPLSYFSSAIVPNTIKGKGFIIREGSTAEVSNDLLVYALIVNREIISKKRGTLAAGLGLTLVDYNMSVYIENTLPTTTVGYYLPAPMLGVDYNYNTPRWEFNILLSGIAVRIDNISIAYSNSVFSARYKFLKHDDKVMMITAGAKHLFISTDADVEDFYLKSNTTYFGPYIGVRYEIVK